MKVGIFGDSFAADKFNETPSWTEILAEKYDVTVHAIRGSNLYYAVNQFKKHNHNYDKIIFVVTLPGRQQIADWIPVPAPIYRYVPSPNQVEVYFSNLKKDISQNLEQAYKAALDYFKYMQTYDFEVYVHNLMCEDIRNLRSDTVMVPAFGNSLTETKKNCLNDIWNKENTAWGYNNIFPTSGLTYLDIRNCHMTAENNVILAKKADSWIHGHEVVIDVNDFVTPMNKEFYILKNNK